MLATAADIIVVVIVATVTVAIDIAPITLIALAFVLHCLLVLLLHGLVVACCFASIAGIFTAHPSVSQLLCWPRIDVLVR